MQKVAWRVEGDDYLSVHPVQATDLPDVFLSPASGEIIVQRPAHGGVLVLPLPQAE